MLKLKHNILDGLDISQKRLYSNNKDSQHVLEQHTGANFLDFMQIHVHIYRDIQIKLSCKVYTMTYVHLHIQILPQ